MHKLKSPLRVAKSKNKDFILNLNTYRNTYHQSLNKAKKSYKEVMTEQILALPVYEYPIHIEYVLYPKTRALTDVGNVCCVHQKFFEDALTELGRIEDDNYLYVPNSTFSFGNIDKDNPRVDIIITRAKESADELALKAAR